MIYVNISKECTSKCYYCFLEMPRQGFFFLSVIAETDDSHLALSENSFFRSLAKSIAERCMKYGFHETLRTFAHCIAYHKDTNIFHIERIEITSSLSSCRVQTFKAWAWWWKINFNFKFFFFCINSSQIWNLNSFPHELNDKMLLKNSS